MCTTDRTRGSVFFWMMVLAGFMVNIFATRALALTYVVDTTLDTNLSACSVAAGDCSLRGAANNAAANPGLDVIEFQIPGTGPFVIPVGVAHPINQLDTGGVSLDGSTQAGYNPTLNVPVPQIVLDGMGDGGIASLGPSSVVRAIYFRDVHNNTGRPIGYLHDGATLEGCWHSTTGNYGTSSGGFVVVGSNVRVGGSTPAQRNVFWGFGYFGALIVRPASGVTRNILIQGNYIGFDPNGSVASQRNNQGIVVEANVDGVQILGNHIVNSAEMGVYATNGLYGTAGAAPLHIQIGDGTVAGRNVISANAGNGISLLVGSGHTIRGNFIGVDDSGNAAFGNVGAGVYVSSVATIGGPLTGDRNVISDNSSGVIVSGAASAGTILENNFIGLGVDGTTALGNRTSQGHGIRIEGGAQNIVVRSNVVSSNAADGINIVPGNATVSGFTILGNRIGTTADGTNARANANVGIRVGANTQFVVNGVVVGDGTSGGRNLISGNGRHAVYIVGGSNHALRGNWIGVDISGNIRLANGLAGPSMACRLDDTSDTTLDANIISGHGPPGSGFLDYYGFVAFGSNARMQFTNNIVGLGADGITAVGNRGGGALWGQGQQNDIVVDGNVFSSNGGAGVTVYSVAAGQVVNGFAFRGNQVGTTRAGTGVRSNGQSGLVLQASGGGSITAARIGDGTPSGTNILSGNTDDGLAILGIGNAGHTILGNRIGTDATGAVAFPNRNGINISGGSTITIGGRVAMRNLVSGNRENGVSVSGSVDALAIVNNFVGTDVLGSLALPNGYAGVLLNGASITATSIGDGSAGGGNLLSGNTNDGLRIVNAVGTRVRGNILGLDAQGVVSIANGSADGYAGIGISGGISSGTVIGGPGTNERNFIAGNRNLGIEVFNCSGDLRIENNVFGMRVDGSATVPSGTNTMTFWGSGTMATTIGPNNRIRGQAGGIASNALGMRIAVRANSISNNGGLGVYFESGSVVPNDDGDVDSGANDGLNFPVLTAAWTDAGTLVLRGFAPPRAEIDCYADPGDPSGFGEGELYLGTWIEGSAGDQDNTVGSYNYPGIGQETAARRFTFTPQISSLLNLPGGAFPAGYRVSCTSNVDGGSGRFITSAFGNSYRVVPAPDGPVVLSPTADFVSNRNVVTVSGTIEAETAISVDVFDDIASELLCTATVTNGLWRCDTGRLDDRNYELVVVANLPLGQTLPGASGVQIVIDTHAPAAPTIQMLRVTSRTNGLPPANASNDATPTLTGTGEARALVTILRGTDVLGTQLADNAGMWSWTPVRNLSDGTYTFTAQQSDAAGNVSGLSAALGPWVLDATAPSVVTSFVISPATAAATRTITPNFTGAGEDGAVVEVRDGDSEPACIATVAARRWSCDASLAAQSHVYRFSAMQIDSAGNSSLPSSALRYEVDVDAPAGTAVSAPAPGATVGPVSSLSGVAEAGATVRATLDGVPVVCVEGAIVSNAERSWECTLPATITIEGSHSLVLVATDAAGNASVPLNTTFVVDAMLPGLANLTSPNTRRPVTNGLVASFRGRCSTGNQVQVIRGIASTGTLLCTTTCDVNGAYVCVPNPAATLAVGTNLISISTSIANQSFIATNTTTITYVNALSAVVVIEPTLGSTQTSVSPIIRGTGYPGATVTATRPGVNGQPMSVGSAEVDATGNWSFTPTVAFRDGTHTLSITQSYGTSPEPLLTSPATVAMFVIVGNAPVAPTVIAPTNGSAIGTTTAVFRGTADPNTTIEIRTASGNVVCMVAVENDGTWSCSPATLAAGQNVSFTVIARDAQGMTSPATTITGLTVEAPLLRPTITSPASGSATDLRPTFRGSGTTGATIEVLDGTNVVCTTEVVAEMWRCQASADLSEGGHIIVAVQGRNGTRSPPSGPINIQCVRATTPDASVPADAGVTDAALVPPRATGGCGCSVAGSRATGLSFMAGLLILSAGLLRNRRARQSAQFHSRSA